MKYLLLIFLTIIVYCCSRTATEDYSFIDKAFWENLRLASGAENIEISFESELETKTMKIDFINSNFVYNNFTEYVKVSDSLLTVIFLNSQIDTSRHNFSISFSNGIHKNVNHYTIDEVYSTLGKRKFFEQDYDNAVVYFDKAIRKNPKNEVFYFYKATCLHKVKKYKESLESIKNYFNLKPNGSISSLVLLAKIYRDFNDYQNNKITIDKILNIDPNVDISEIQLGNG